MFRLRHSRFASWLVVSAVLLAGCGSTPVAVQQPTTRPLAVAPPAQATAAPPTMQATQHPTDVPTATPEPTVTPSPTPDAATIHARAGMPVFCYHAIRDWIPTDSAVDKQYIVPPARFAAEIEMLAQQGYHTITPDQFYAHLTTNAPLPERPVMLTFDDADGTQWTYAVPLLQKHQFTATFFIMTVVLDKPGYLSREQIAQLNQQGMTIGAHTWDHHRVTRYSEEDWEIQLTRPTQELEQLVGHPIRYFAYPYGLWDTTAISHLKAAHFVAAFQLHGTLDTTDPLFTLPRMIASGVWNDEHFQAALKRDV